MNEPEPLRAPRRFARDIIPDEPAPRRRWPWLLIVLLLIFLAPLEAVLALRWLPPPTSAFMLQSEVKPVEYRWVPAARIPEALRRAAVASEDQKFWTHNGFDLEAISEAMEHNRRSRRIRGASTISQQVAKNLFLWPGRSYVRKGLEAMFTILIEQVWGKNRILEVYLNVAQFGPGVYGAQAAAQRFFHKDSDQLTPAECAQLIAVLPNPTHWKAGSPGPYVRARTDWILGQIGQSPRYAALPATEPEPPSSGTEPAPLPDDEPAPPEGVPQASGEPASPAPTPPEEQPAPQEPPPPSDEQAAPAPQPQAP